MKYKNVHIQYFDSQSSIFHYLDHLKQDGWEIINYTGSLFKKLSYTKFQVGHRNAHDVIGQEYDKVVAVITEHFRYDENGLLWSTKEYGSPGYALDKMLYQILTRAREEILIVINNNRRVLESCLNILNNS